MNSSNLSFDPPPPPSNASKEATIIDAAVAVAVFSKTHAYPKEHTPDFFEFTEKLDRLSTAINARYPDFNRNTQKASRS